MELATDKAHSNSRTHTHTPTENTSERRNRDAKSDFPEKMDPQDSGEGKQSTADMTQFVQTLLQQMQARFQTMSESIVSKIDEMGGRISELEQSINDLRTEMGAEGSPSPLPPSKKSDDGKPEEGSA